MSLSKKLKAHYLDESDKYWRSPNDGFSWLIIAWAITLVLIVFGSTIRNQCQKFRNFDTNWERNDSFVVIHRSKSQPELVHMVTTQDALTLPPEVTEATIGNVPTPYSTPSFPNSPQPSYLPGHSIML